MDNIVKRFYPCCITIQGGESCGVFLFLLSVFLFSQLTVAYSAQNNTLSQQSQMQRAKPVMQAPRPSQKTQMKSTSFKKQTDAQAWLKNIVYNWTIEEMKTKKSLNLQKYSQQTAQLITDASMPYIAKNKHLQKLFLSYTGITDAAIPTIRQEKWGTEHVSSYLVANPVEFPFS